MAETCGSQAKKSRTETLSGQHPPERQHHARMHSLHNLRSSPLMLEQWLRQEPSFMERFWGRANWVTCVPGLYRSAASNGVHWTREETSLRKVPTYEIVASDSGYGGSHDQASVIQMSQKAASDIGEEPCDLADVHERLPIANVSFADRLLEQNHSSFFFPSGKDNGLIYHWGKASTDSDSISTVEPMGSRPPERREQSVMPSVKDSMSRHHGRGFLDGRPLTETRQCPVNGSGGPCNSSYRSGEVTSNGSQHKRRLGSDRSHEDDHERSKRRRGGTGGSDKGQGESKDEEGSSGRRYACPFYKRNPQMYANDGPWGCAYRSFPFVHQVKEHIYLYHSDSPHRCRRCFQNFKDQHKLDAHLAKPQQCGSRPGLAQGDINAEQLGQLKSKKRSHLHKGSRAKWCDIYRILFPEDSPIPSPYQEVLHTSVQDHRVHDTNQLDGTSTDRLPPSNDLSSFLVGRFHSIAERASDRNNGDEVEGLLVNLLQELRVRNRTEAARMTDSGSFVVTTNETNSMENSLGHTGPPESLIMPSNSAVESWSSLELIQTVEEGTSNFEEAFSLSERWNDDTVKHFEEPDEDLWGGSPSVEGH